MILVLFAIGAPGSVYAYNSYNYNKLYNSGQANIENEKYDEAMSSFNAALKYGKKYSEKISNQVSLAEDLKASKTIYESGLKLQNEKKYLEAVSIFENITKEDNNRYKLSKDRISECRNLYINENMENAKKEAVDKKYVEGIKFLDLALKIDPENEQA